MNFLWISDINKLNQETEVGHATEEKGTLKIPKLGAQMSSGLN